LKTVENGTIERDKPVFFEWRNSRAVIDGHWKLVVHKIPPKDVETGLWDFSTGEWELYDLSKDRTELNNLADSHPEKLAELRDKFDAWWTEVEPGS
jgi:arylsulfatase